MNKNYMTANSRYTTKQKHHVGGEIPDNNNTNIAEAQEALPTAIKKPALNEPFQLTALYVCSTCPYREPTYLSLDDTD